MTKADRVFIWTVTAFGLLYVLLERGDWTNFAKTVVSALYAILWAICLFVIYYSIKTSVHLRREDLDEWKSYEPAIPEFKPQPPSKWKPVLGGLILCTVSISAIAFSIHGVISTGSISSPHKPIPPPPPTLASGMQSATKSSSPSPQPLRKLNLIFKDSPVFTPTRKEQIANTLESFYRYLTALGFSLPTRIPPLGTHQGKGSTSGGVYPGDPVYSSSIDIGVDSINDSSYIREIYASYWFENLLDVHAPLSSGNLLADRMWMANIIARYYAHSSSSSPPVPNPKSFNGWLDALWQMRQEFKGDFIDRALFYAVGAKEMEPAPYDPLMKEFNRYFYHRFGSGEYVVDNDLKHLPRINEILRSRGLLQW